MFFRRFIHYLIDASLDLHAFVYYCSCLTALLPQSPPSTVLTKFKSWFCLIICLKELFSKESIPYRRLYWFGQRYDIFRISVNTSVPFRVYCYFLYLYIYIYIYICVCVCVCVCVIINIKVYQKTFPLFKTNYSWF